VEHLMKNRDMKFVWFGALLLFSLSASTVHAAPSSKVDLSPVEGVVVKVTNGEIIIDLGHTQGLPDAANVHVYRRVEVTHPVTQKAVVDRFPIGRMQLAKVGDKLSIGTSAESLDRLPTVGDYVVWTPPSPATTPNTPGPNQTDPNQTDPNQTDPISPATKSSCSSEVETKTGGCASMTRPKSPAS
jgi:hypothetical protein